MKLVLKFVDQVPTLSVRYLLILPLLVFVLAANIGLVPVPFTLPPAWLPVEQRAIGMSMMVPIGFGFLLTLSIVFPYLLIEINNYTFLIFATVCALSFVVGWFKLE